MKNKTAERVDLVNIKADVRANRIEFYIEDNVIYCRDKTSGEIVIVGQDIQSDLTTWQGVDLMNKFELQNRACGSGGAGTSDKPDGIVSGGSMDAKLAIQILENMHFDDQLEQMSIALAIRTMRGMFHV